MTLITLRAFAGPATAPAATEADDKIQTQTKAAADAAGLPTINARSPADVLQMAVQADMLTAQSPLKDGLPIARLALPNPGIVATVQRFPRIGRHANAPHGFSMLLRDFSAPGSMTVFTSISSIDGRLQLSRDSESSTMIGSIQLIQDAPALPGQRSPNSQPVRLFISRVNQQTQQNEVKLTLSAPTFIALYRAHTTETEEYLRPIFHDLGQEAAVFAPDPAAVWQALSADWKPDENVTRAVKQTIAKFDAEDYQQRQSAAHELHQMGEPAALTLMRIDRTKFSAAEASGVDTFLAPYLPLSPAEAERLGNNRDYLLDSQYSSDISLRQLAAARLAKITGHPAGFDPAADDDTRMAQVREVRRSLTTTAP